MKVVICGGHLSPALALIEKLEREKGVEIIFFGRKHSAEGSRKLSAEHQVLSHKNIKFYKITAGRLQRKFTRYTLISLVKVPIGFIQCFIFLILIRPKVVISFGGYLSLPVIFSAWLLGIRAITHEQSSVPGLANKINSLFVEKIYLSWPQTTKYFDTKKVEVIGNLTRESIFSKKAQLKKITDFINRSKNLIYVTGGNQGSHFINRLIMSSKKLLSNYSIIHQLGTLNYKGDFDNAQKLNKENYLALDFITAADIGAVLNKADLVISRSGANTVWELALLAKPSLLIPLKIAAANEQEKNARILEEAGCARVLLQNEATTDTLEQEVEKIFANLNTFRRQAQKLQKDLPSDASTKLARFVLGYN